MDRPILFSGEMVRAILEGRKTQTRRVVKTLVNTVDGTEYCFHLTKDGMWEVGFDYQNGMGDFLRYMKCPYGQIGDRLWVRETFHQHYSGGVLGGRPCYRADNDCLNPSNIIPWKHSIFMPRWASRITLEIVNVRVERLQDISENDASKEGCNLEWYANNAGSANLWPCPTCGGNQVYPTAYPPDYGVIEVDCDDCNTSKKMFKHLWESINNKTYPWDSNPWVWVVEFKVVS